MFLIFKEVNVLDLELLKTVKSGASGRNYILLLWFWKVIAFGIVQNLHNIKDEYIVKMIVLEVTDPFISFT